MGRTMSSQTTRRGVQTYVRLDPDSRANLERIAAQEGRTLSGHIRFVLERHLDEREAQAA